VVSIYSRPSLSWIAYGEQVRRGERYIRQTKVGQFGAGKIIQHPVRFRVGLNLADRLRGDDKSS
jgi:hypothetical protein